MSELTDILGVLNLETWDATGTSVLSYLKTPIQQNFFTANSELIGKVLRRAIIYFDDTTEEIDRKSCAIGNEFRSLRTHKYPLPPPADSKTPTIMEITTYAPIAFKYMRTNIGITQGDFQHSFDDGEFMNFVNTGKSGSQMYKTHDDVYVIKTLRDHEAKLLIQILSGLDLRYLHIASLLTRYVGLYSVSMRSIFPTDIYCVVMINSLPSIMNIHEIYDLKGSSVGRQSSIDFPSKRSKALKDLDFEFSFPQGIRIPNEVYRRLKMVIENDISELRKLMITDFSLLLGVHYLDEYSENKENPNETSRKLHQKPELGVSSLFAITKIDRAAFETNMNNNDNNNSDQTNSKKFLLPSSMLTNRFIMKPLRLIICSKADTFADDPIANSFLGIPGITHKGHRVLLYPTFIDCLQTFDNFKRVQNVLQNVRDPERAPEYSVIPPPEYEKRILQFLFEKVFIDSKLTLDELLESPIPPEPIQRRESFEIVRTTEVIERVVIQPLSTTNDEKRNSETTAL